MIASIDVWRAANALIRAHGDEAPRVAAQMADDLLAQGDFEGQSILKSVLRAIAELRRAVLRQGEQAN